MATAQELIRTALKKINVIDPLETATASEMQDGLAELNRMLDTWTANRQMIFARNEVTKVLTAGLGEYSIGSGGDIDTSRPEGIETAFVRDSSGFDHSLDVNMSQTEYNWIGHKSTQGIPYRLYYHKSHPLGMVYFYYVPDSTSTYTVYLYAWQPFTTVASLTTSLSYPPGYEDALVGSLAKRLAPDYKAVVSQELATFTAEALDSITSNNVVVKPVDMGLDSFNREVPMFDITEG